MRHVALSLCLRSTKRSELFMKSHIKDSHLLKAPNEAFKLSAGVNHLIL